MATVIARPERRAASAGKVDLVAVAHGRIMLLLLLFGAATLVLAGRMLWMGLSHAGQPDRLVSAMPVPDRADIVDRNGVPLARDIKAYAIGVRPERLINNPRWLAQRLHGIFPDESEAEFYATLTAKTHWTYLRRRALPSQVAQVNALGEVGIDFPRDKERLYPQRTLAAHLVGFTNRARHGVMGVERAFDTRLTDPKLRGEPLVLALDVRVQAALQDELAKGVAIQSAKSAAAVVLNVHTGEIVAMASMPSFNPNKIQPVEQAATAPGEAPKPLTCAMSPRCNHAIQSDYELGSVLKPIAIGAAMDDGVVTSMSKLYDASKPLMIEGHTIHDDHALNRWLDVPETLVHSSNIATSRIADEMGADRLQAAYRKFGFDSRVAVDLPGAANPIWPRRWDRLTTMTAAFGQGIAMTPLHLALAYAALVNGGIWHPATVLKHEPGQPVPGRRVFSAETSARMRQLLRLIVTAGTGGHADAPGYRVGGKTGSAEKPNEAGGYDQHRLVSTFAAAFPMDNPQYVVLVTMDQPKGSAEHPGLRTAAWTAAPVVKALIERAGSMLGVYPALSRDVDLSELMPLLHGDKESE